MFALPVSRIITPGFLLFLPIISFAQATTTVTTSTPTVVERRIITAVPPAKETIVVPTGYTNCFTVQDSWVGETWVPAHRVCQYASAAQGSTWIEGYWACDKYNLTTSECTNWVWRAPRWVTSKVEWY